MTDYLHNNTNLIRLVLQWITDVRLCVEGGGDKLKLQSLHNLQQVQDINVDAVIQLQTNDLPRPLQTLLNALRDVNLDLIAEEHRIHSNAYNATRQWCENRITMVCQAFDDCVANIHAANNMLWTSLNDTSLRNDVAKCLALHSVNVTELPQPHQWTELLTAKIIELTVLQQQQKLQRMSQKAPSIKCPEYASLSNAEHAVQMSMQMRHRLIELAEGPLATLFEMSDRSTEINTVEPEVQAAEQVVTSIIDYASDIAKCKQTLRAVQRAVSIARATRDVWYDDAVAGLVIALRTCENKCTDNFDEVHTNTGDIRAADSKIQKEIALLLNTLTVDKKSLAHNLHLIKTACKHKRAAYASEIDASNTIITAQWSKRIMSHLKAYHDSLKVV